MAENDGISDEERAELEEEYSEVSAEMTAEMTALTEAGGYGFIDDVSLINAVYYVWAHWIDFHIYVLAPLLPQHLPPKQIKAEIDPKTKKLEHVYTIFDYGNRLSASVGEDLVKGTRSTGKMLNTVKKMVLLLLEKLKEAEGGELSAEKEIQLAFDGHELSQRMAFKDCIMRPENLTITNFEPGNWGELQLRVMEELAKKGYLPGL